MSTRYVAPKITPAKEVMILDLEDDEEDPLDLATLVRRGSGLRLELEESKENAASSSSDETHSEGSLALARQAQLAEELATK